MYCLNNLRTQHVLLDRRLVYSILKRNNIPVPRHAFVNRDGGPYKNEPQPVFKESGSFLNRLYLLLMR
jgi:hypothetical protein